MSAVSVINQLLDELAAEPTQGWVHGQRQDAKRSVLREALRRIDLDLFPPPGEPVIYQGGGSDTKVRFQTERMSLYDD